MWRCEGDCEGWIYKLQYNRKVTVKVGLWIAHSHKKLCFPSVLEIVMFKNMPR